MTGRDYIYSGEYRESLVSCRFNFVLIVKHTGQVSQISVDQEGEVLAGCSEDICSFSNCSNCNKLLKC